MFSGTVRRRTQKTSSEIDLPDLPHTRPDLPQVRPSFSPGMGVERALGRLAGTHLRVTLCRLSPESGWDAASALAEALEDPSLLVSQLDDGTLWILDAGPRSSGRAGDFEAEAAINRKLCAAVAQLGLGETFEGTTVSVVHCWADAIDLSHGASDPFALASSERLDRQERVAA